MGDYCESLSPAMVNVQKSYLICLMHYIFQTHHSCVKMAFYVWSIFYLLLNFLISQMPNCNILIRSTQEKSQKASEVIKSWNVWEKNFQKLIVLLQLTSKIISEYESRSWVSLTYGVFSIYLFSWLFYFSLFRLYYQRRRKFEIFWLIKWVPTS